MSLSGSKVSLIIDAPVLGDHLTNKVTQTVRNNLTEFKNVADYARTGEAVVEAKIDIKWNYVDYEITDQTYHSFGAAPGGFNGYVLSFSAFKIHSVKVKVDEIGLEKRDVWFKGNKLFINVESETFSTGDSLGIELGFKVDGGRKRDDLSGLSGNDFLNGRRGNDKLAGKQGNDKLKGGAGRDKFKFGLGDDRDTILDFKNNVDTLILDKDLWKGSKSKKMVLNTFGSKMGDDFVLDFGSGDKLTLKDVTKAQLVDDLVFV